LFNWNKNNAELHYVKGVGFAAKQICNSGIKGNARIGAQEERIYPVYLLSFY
jgi:hypothetical protein